MTKGAFAMSFLKSGFNFNRAMSRDARAFGARAPEVLVKELRDHADDRTLPPGVKAPNMLGDTVVHQQDCRRPLGMSRTIRGAECVVLGMKGVQPVLGNKSDRRAPSSWQPTWTGRAAKGLEVRYRRGVAHGDERADRRSTT